MSTATGPVRPGLVSAGAVAVLAAVLATVAARQGSVDLLDPGGLVRWGGPVASTLSHLAGAVTLGTLLLAAAVLPRPGGRRPGDGSAWPATMRVASAAAGVWTVLALADLVLGYGALAGRPLDAPTFGPELGLYVSSITLGRVGLGVVVVAAVTSVVAVLVRTPTGALWTAVLAAVALVLQAQTGHASGDTNHELAISTMFLHLAGAAVWIGGLAGLALVAGRLGRDLPAAVARYSVVALWAFLAVATSGVVNAGLRLSGPADLALTVYGRLVVAKVLLTAALGALGWVHRRRVVAGLATTWREPGARDREGRLRPPCLFWRLVAAELAVMGAVSGVAVALGSAEPPDPQTPAGALTPAEIVTGHALPDPLTSERWLTVFRWDLLLALAALAGAVVYVRWVRRLRARGDRWPLGRTASWLVGLAVFVWATSAGPATYGHVLLSVHMVQHMTLMLVVPVFLVLAGPVTLAVRALPVRQDGSRGPREWLLALIHSRWAGFFAHPLVAAANVAGSMYVFYYTDLFRLSLETYLGHLAMVVHFSLAGYLFLNSLIGIDPGPTRQPYPIRLVVLFTTMAVHAFFGVALTIQTGLLVPEWYGLLGRTWGPSVLDDQRQAGAIIWGISELPMLAVAIVLAIGWTRSDERTARRRDRAADRDGDAELAAYNARLAAIAEADRRAAERGRS